MAGASDQTQRVRYVNANWTATEDGQDGEFSIMIVTEDEERHSISVSAAAATALVALTQAGSVLLWDPDHRCLITANLVGEWLPEDWSAIYRPSDLATGEHAVGS